jgi:hypothetical protein
MTLSTTNVDTARWLLCIGKHSASERNRSGTFPGLIRVNGNRRRISLFAIAEGLGGNFDDVHVRSASW